MLSWILRHRARLTVIYGLAPLPPLAGPRFAQASDAVCPPADGEETARPGVLRRTARGRIELRPMPRRVA